MTELSGGGNCKLLKFSFKSEGFASVEEGRLGNVNVEVAPSHLCLGGGRTSHPGIWYKSLEGGLHGGGVKNWKTIFKVFEWGLLAMVSMIRVVTLSLLPVQYLKNGNVAV